MKKRKKSGICVIIAEEDSEGVTVKTLADYDNPKLIACIFAETRKLLDEYFPQVNDEN